MTMPLAHPAPPAEAPPRSTTAAGYTTRDARAANDPRRPVHPSLDGTPVNVAAAIASAVLALGWLDAVARIAALYG